MGLHDAAIMIALERGDLGSPQVARVRDQCPAWLLRLASRGGIAEYEAIAGIRLPQAVIDFYAATDLICLLEASQECGHWGFHTKTANRWSINPPIEDLFGRKYVIVDEHWHSGSRGCLPLDAGDDSPVYGSVADDPLFCIAPSFTKYIRDQTASLFGKSGS